MFILQLFLLKDIEVFTAVIISVKRSRLFLFSFYLSATKSPIPYLDGDVVDSQQKLISGTFLTSFPLSRGEGEMILVTRW